MQVIDLRHIEFGITNNSSGSAGCFLKGIEIVDKTRYHYKLSNFDTYKGFIGHEAINEVIASKVGYALGLDVLNYELVKCKVNIQGTEYITYASKSKDFKNQNESKIEFDQYYDINKNSEKETPLDFIKRIGFEDYVYKMFLFDYIIFNRDRHGANIEVLKTGDSVRLSPYFDNGSSFYATCFSQNEIDEYDPMKEIPVNNFIGTRSLRDNLNFIDKPIEVNSLTEQDIIKIINEIEGLNDKHKDRIIEMLEGRYNYAKRILDSKLWDKNRKTSIRHSPKRI